jgi:hypothetical protein
MVWDEHLAEYLALPWQERQAFLASIASLRTLLVASTEADLAWMRETLGNEEAKWFVTDVLRITGFVPPSLSVDLLRAAVAEKSCDDNRFFLEPALAVEGVDAVRCHLVSIIVSRSPAEQQGAASALYWTWGSPFSPSHLFELFTTFLTTTDLILRQELLPHLPLGPKCPETLRPLDDSGAAAALGGVAHHRKIPSARILEEVSLSVS